MVDYTEVYMSIAIKDSQMVNDLVMDDWTILEMPTTTATNLAADNVDGWEFYFDMGMAGVDLTTFTEYCYAIIENTEITYHAPEYAGCPAHLIRYYDGLMFGIYANYYSSDKYETYDNNPTFYAAGYELYICPGESMDCAYTWITESSYLSAYYAIFYAGTAIVNTFDLADGDAFSGAYRLDWHYNMDYQNYGFSSTQFGSIMNIDDEGAGEGDYWFDYNAGNGYMHWFRFLAVNDERLDIGDTLTVWVAESENNEWMSTSVELASGVSLAASAAAVLASATLL
jgi:hypothetical protein